MENFMSADLNETELNEINGLTSSLLLGVLAKFDLLIEDIHKEKACPTSNAEWTDLLLYIVFDACALTFKAADGGVTAKKHQRKGTICKQACQSYLLGSSFDGLGCAIPGRFLDTDVMNVLDEFIATQSGNLDCKTETAALGEKTNDPSTVQQIVLKPGSFPCYTKLQQSEATTKLVQLAKSLNYGPVIRSEKREALLVHTFEFDDSIAVQCDSWPTESHPWKTRHRLAQWPTAAMIRKSTETPSYIVSKAHLSNADDKLEWRYSFGRQEVLLLRELSTMMKMTYVVSKFLLKQIITSDDSLSTYHLKH